MRALFLLMVCFALSLQTLAKSHPYGLEFEKTADQLLYVNGRLSQEKLDAYIQRLEQKHLEVVGLVNGRLANNSILISKYRLGGKSDKKIIDKLEKHEVHLALMEAIEAMKSLTLQSSRAEVLNKTYLAMDTENTIRIEGDGLIWSQISKVAGAILKEWKISKESAPEQEASNLVDARGGDFLSVDDIAGIKRAGYDLSLYQPAANSTFWQRQNDISKVDMDVASMGGNLEAYRGVDIGFPKDNVLYYDSVRHSDTKPKLNTYYIDENGEEQEVKLKLGAELHSDPTSAALANALGFPSDITKYARGIKLILGKKDLREFSKDWEAYYKRGNGRINYNVEDYIVDSGKDKDGNNYIVFQDGLMEAKPSQLERLGPWSFSDESKLSFREVRALMLVQIWISNADIVFGNNEVLLKNTKNGLERYHIVSDLGYTYGNLFPENPDVYGWEIITGDSKDSLKLRFTSFNEGIKNKISVADAKWGTRLIAQLTREQIEKAVDIGSWPMCMRPILAEKLISRRNNLVQKLGLEGERLENGNVIRMIPQNVDRDQMKIKYLCDQKQIAEESSQSFDNSVEKIFEDVIMAIRTGAIDISRGLINSADRITLSPDHFHTELGLVSEIIVDPKREIERNTDAKTAAEQFIVRDSLEIGLRLGVKYGPFVDTTITRKYTLAYPIRSMDEARLNNGFLVNIFLPLDIAKDKLPESYVLETNRYFEKGAGVALEHALSLVTPGLEIGFAPKVVLWRSVLDHRDPSNVIFYRDRARFSKLFAEAFLKIGLLRMPIFEQLHKWGGADGRGVKFNSDELYGDRKMSLFVDAAIHNDDYTAIAPLEQEFYMTSVFTELNRKWSFLFWGSERNRKLEHLKLEDINEKKELIQYETSNSKQYSWGGDIEKKRIAVDVYANKSELNNYQMDVSILGVDALTKDKEMNYSYLNFVNGINPTDERTIPFTPGLGYSTNGRWGYVITTSETTYYPEALQNILKADKNTFWVLLARKMNVSNKEMGVLLGNYQAYRKARRTSTVANRLRYYDLERDQYVAIHTMYQFLDKLEVAQKAKSFEDKIKGLAEAVRRAAYSEKTEILGQSFFEPTLLWTINKVAGVDNIFSKNMLTNPIGSEVNMIEGEPLYGEFGKRRRSSADYLVYSPITPIELYTMFDSWF